MPLNSSVDNCVILISYFLIISPLVSQESYSTQADLALKFLEEYVCLSKKVHFNHICLYITTLASVRGTPLTKTWNVFIENCVFIFTC